LEVFGVVLALFSGAVWWHGGLSEGCFVVEENRGKVVVSGGLSWGVEEVRVVVRYMGSV